jgi:ubiquitin-conjugating enzyme E2 O
MNRPGMAGFRKRAPKKKKADEEEVLNRIREGGEDSQVEETGPCSD